MKEINVSDGLKASVKEVVGGLYSMNAARAIGYLFCSNGYSISMGMFCHLEREIDPDQWSYYFDYKTKKYYRLD